VPRDVIEPWQGPRLEGVSEGPFVELDDALPKSHVVSTIDAIRGVAPTTQVALKVPE
jgi:hypothetical protein